MCRPLNSNLVCTQLLFRLIYSCNANRYSDSLISVPISASYHNIGSANMVPIIQTLNITYTVTGTLIHLIMGLSTLNSQDTIIDLF